MTVATHRLGAMQDSVLTLESFESSDRMEKEGKLTLKGTSQQCVAFDSGKSNRAY